MIERVFLKCSGRHEFFIILFVFSKNITLHVELRDLNLQLRVEKIEITQLLIEAHVVGYNSSKRKKKKAIILITFISRKS